MVEGCGRLGLLPEAGEEVRIVAVLGAQDLDRHVPLELGVPGAIDGGHPALAEQLQEPVAPAQDRADVCHAPPSSGARPPALGAGHGIGRRLRRPPGSYRTTYEGRARVTLRPA